MPDEKLDSYALDFVREEFDKDCDVVAMQCAEEGYSSNGDNYDLRAEQLKQDYSELFGEV